MADNDPHSAYNFVRNWNSWKHETARRDALKLGGPHAQSWTSAPITDTRSVATSFGGAGFIIGMFGGALTATSNHIPILQGLIVGGLKAAAIGAVFGYLLSKFCIKFVEFGFAGAFGALFGTIWQGAKWGALAGIVISLIGYRQAYMSWVVAFAVAGIAINILREAYTYLRSLRKTAR